MPDKHNTLQTHLINPWKIVSNTASLPRDVSPVFLAGAAVVILGCFSLPKPWSWGGQAFARFLALLEGCSDSCLAWVAANTCFGSAMNGFFPLISAILPSTVSHEAENPPFPHLHLWHASLLVLSHVLVCDCGLNHCFVGCRLPSHTDLWSTTYT